MNKTLTFSALTGGTFAAVGAAMLFNPGPAFPAPRLLGTAVKAALPVAGNYTLDPVH